MKVYRIKSVTDGQYKPFYDIYSISFPIHEQRNGQQQVYAFGRENYHLDCYLNDEDDRIAGFIAYWDFENLIYIEHLAVNPDLRGKNIGTQMLSEFIESQAGKPVLLEIDPLVDEISRKRLQFYRRLGFVTNEYEHHHPAYDKKFPPHRLIVLSVPGRILQSEYDYFYKKLSGEVMVMPEG